jgi:Sulfatase
MSRWRTLLPVTLIVSFAMIPFAKLAADNGRAITLTQVLPYLLVATAPAVVVVAVMSWRRGVRTAEPTACALAIALLLVFDYRELSPVLRRLASEHVISTLFLWAALTGIAGALTARAARRHAVVPVYLLLGGLVALAPPLVKALDYQISRPQPAVSFTPPVIAGAPPSPRVKPDVYFFMLDAYARGDRLEHRFGFRDDRFQRFLHSYGFVVPPRSHSDYAVTTLSAASMLDMGYPIRSGAYSWEALRPFHVGRNRTVSSFKRLGYEFALAPAGIEDYTCRGYEDICVHDRKTTGGRLGWSDLTWAVAERTPLADVIERLMPNDPTDSLGATRQFPVNVVKKVAADRDARPVFTYAHVLLTHPPYLYLGRRCVFQPDAHARRDVAAYLASIECANAQVERAVRMITARDPNAIVILASDHGSDIRVPHGTPEWHWSQLRIARRFSNFVALRLPPTCRSDVPPDIAAVNILRVTLSCISGRAVPMLAAKRYLVDEVAQRVRPAPTAHPA